MLRAQKFQPWCCPKAFFRGSSVPALDLCDSPVADLSGNADRHRAADRLNDTGCAAFFSMLGVRVPLVPIGCDITHCTATDLCGNSITEQAALDCQYATASRAADKLVGRKENRIKGCAGYIHINRKVRRSRRVIPHGEGAMIFEYSGNSVDV